VRDAGRQIPEPRRGRDGEDDNEGDPMHALRMGRISLAL
jgi:hypothetical protein